MCAASLNLVAARASIRSRENETRHFAVRDLSLLLRFRWVRLCHPVQFHAIRHDELVYDGLVLEREIPSRGNEFYWVKGGSGYPWDVNYYDSNYIYQWATEYQWNDPTSYKAFGGAGMPWSPRCVNMPAPGVYGTKLATITRASSPYTVYGSNCTASSAANLGYVINEVWGPTPLSLGGSLAPNTLTLTLSYRYSCNSSYDSCKYKETFDFQRPYGLVRWIYYILQNGQYVQQNHTVYNQKVSGGAPFPDHPCW